ncbi:MAG: preprotein translocase subunit SecA [Gammaproteobacteria bacterium]|nr:preprotein translocase subunit SecA [Gammaproteobacteria bacterium]
MRAVPLHPSAAFGVYPQRDDAQPGWLERSAEALVAPIRNPGRTSYRRLTGIIDLANRQGPGLTAKSDGELAELARGLRFRLKRSGFAPPLVGEAFALIREVAGRRLGIRHFDVQLAGGWAMLSGMIAEMETGEGKTLAATLPACTAALAGIPVHVITVNDYLARRDAAWMKPVYEALGLTVGTAVADMDTDSRREAYACDVTYSTNKQVAFDYLRDRILLRRHPSRLGLRLQALKGEEAGGERLIMRGLCFGIVDEADSVLVDEAVTPLIISRSGDAGHKHEIYRRALQLAAELEQGADFTIDPRRRELELTEQGKVRLRGLGDPLGGLWRNIRYREELVSQALRALRFYVRDKHYLVQDGKVKIVDEFTGRLMADRSWEGGLHQLIEVKEGCEITGEQEPVGRISYQRFFRRYMALAGMTGTAREVARELQSVYRLNVASIPSNRPVRRVGMPDAFFPTAAQKWAAIVERLEALYAEGRPVLVGTRSVAASEQLAALLDQVGLPHRVLNARQDEHEAEIIAQAGQVGQITVATNMAGRGTDIKLPSEVVDRGGLHVIASERHASRRIDRQLFGRSGRQGDPGSFEAFLSLEDELMSRYGSQPLRYLAARSLRFGLGRLGRAIGAFAITRAQRTAQRQAARLRRNLLKMEEYLGNVLAFSGQLE